MAEERTAGGAGDDARWSVARAREWWRAGAWPVGCNFIPSSAASQLEMWQAATFDPETIARELGFAAELGFNAVRVYLHDLVWEHERDGFLERIDRFLALAAAAGQRVMFVLFDDVWNPEPRPGPQPEPHPARHNAGWVAGPGLAALEAYATDAAVRARLEGYVRGVVGAFAGDARVWLWDVYNEPGGYPRPGGEPVGPRCLPLLADAFAWARAARPSQPLTSGLWWTPLAPVDPRIHALQRANSDVVSFHHYGPPEDLTRQIDALAAETARPLLCSEYLARQLGSRFESHLPIFRARDVGALCWGLVAGRTQTIWSWWSWFDREPKPEPAVWFHDILRPDGTPGDAAEVAALRALLAHPPR